MTKKEIEAIKAKQFEIEILDDLSICEKLEDIMGDSPITVEAIYEKGDEDAIALMENFMSCSPSRFDDFRKEGDRILISVDGKIWVDWEEHIGKYVTNKEIKAIKAKRFEKEILDDPFTYEELKKIMGDSPITAEAIYEKGNQDAIALMKKSMRRSPSRFDDFRKEGDRILISADGKTWTEWEQ